MRECCALLILIPSMGSEAFTKTETIAANDTGIMYLYFETVAVAATHSTLIVTHKAVRREAPCSSKRLAVLQNKNKNRQIV